MNRLLLASMLALSFGAHAGEQVRLLTPVTYDPAASVNDKVREECKVEDALVTDVGDMLRRYKNGGETTTSMDGKVIRMTITHVLGVGGGATTGPKAVSMRVELLDNGKIERSTRMTRWSIGGAFGVFKGTCTILRRDTRVLGKDVAAWLKDPGYVAIDDAPKDAAPESGPASAAAN
jgi:hypothetical protein